VATKGRGNRDFFNPRPRTPVRRKAGWQSLRERIRSPPTIRRADVANGGIWVPLGSPSADWLKRAQFQAREREEEASWSIPRLLGGFVPA
jgi:hypothetical protein